MKKLILFCFLNSSCINFNSTNPNYLAEQALIKKNYKNVEIVGYKFNGCGNYLVYSQEFVAIKKNKKVKGCVCFDYPITHYLIHLDK